MAFDKKELEFTKRGPNFVDMTKPGPPIYNFPISAKEEAARMYRQKGSMWMPYGVEIGVFTPQIIPDNIARGFVFEKNMMSPDKYGGKDMFGVEWEYVPVVGGSMEKPGVPHLLNDISEWRDKIVWPDINSWDWDQSGRDNYEFLHNGQCNSFWFLNGAGFERIISFLGFEQAAVTLIDEDSTDDLKELLQKLVDLHIQLIDAACETYGDGIDSFTYHDDWGSQKAPFFSKDVAREIFVPFQKQITNHIKAKGKFADLHSCGHIELQIENIVAAGWQSWTPMAMNDTRQLYKDWGDKIVISVCDDPLPAGATPEEQKAQAVRFVKEYYSPDKPSQFSLYSNANLTDAYVEGLYETSREMYESGTK